jgi:hypothetical protein
LAILEAEVNKYVDENGNSIIKEWHKVWQAYNAKTVQFLKDTGVLDEATAQEWIAKSDFIPFYRQALDPDSKDKMPPIFSGMTSSATFKKLKGGDTAVTVPLLDAVVRNLDAAISMGMQNVAQQRIVRDMVSIGLSREVKAGQTAKNVINFRVDGKKRSFSIDDPLLFDSMNSAGISSAEQMITSIVGAPATALRELITRDPGFMAVNMLRDTLSTYVTSGASIIPILSTLKNFNTTKTEALARYGIVGGYDLSGNNKDLFKVFSKEMDKRGLGEKNQGSIKSKFIKLWDYLGEKTTMSDASTRSAVFDDVLKRTGNEAEAQWQSQEIINFGRRGNNPIVRVVTAAIPFLNARFQGLDVFWRAAGGHYSTNKELSRSKQAAIFYIRLSYLAGLTAIYFMYISDDDQYKNADEHTRDNNWLFPTPSGRPFKFPIPFEVGFIAKVIPERILSLLAGKSSGAEARDSMVRGVTSTLSINPLGMQFIKPFIEVGFNYNMYTGNAIVPPYMTDKHIEGFVTGRDTTNQIARLIGKQTNISPLKVEHILKGYTGTIGSYVLGMGDEILRHPALIGDDSLQMPSRPIWEYPLMKRFFYNRKNAGAKEDFYELSSEVKKITNTLSKLAEKGEIDEYKKYLKGREIILGMATDVRYIEKRLKIIREQREQIRRSTFSPDEKRAVIDILDLEEKEILVGASILSKKANLPMFNTLYR